MRKVMLGMGGVASGGNQGRAVSALGISVVGSVASVQ